MNIVQLAIGSSLAFLVGGAKSSASLSPFGGAAEFFEVCDASDTSVVLDVSELSELSSREGFAAANIQITWTNRLVTVIAREGYDHRFGARPLQRVIERRIAIPLARWKVANPKAKALTLHLDIDEDGTVVVL